MTTDRHLRECFPVDWRTELLKFAVLETKKTGQVNFRKDFLELFLRTRDKIVDGLVTTNDPRDMARTTSVEQISRTFQGLPKDKLQLSRSKIDTIKRHSSTPF